MPFVIVAVERSVVQAYQLGDKGESCPRKFRSCIIETNRDMVVFGVG